MINNLNMKKINHLDIVLEQADLKFNELLLKEPELYQEADRTGYKLEYLMKAYWELYHLIDDYQCQITNLRDEKDIDD